MPRSWPPVGDRSLHVIGDMHWGRTEMTRFETMARDLASGYEDAAPAGRLQVGDLSHYTPVQQLQNAVAWMDANMPAVAADLGDRNWVGIAGNHDRETATINRHPATDDLTSYDYVGGPGDWEDETGWPDAYSVDLGFALLLNVSWPSPTSLRQTAPQMAWLDAAATAAGKDCIVCTHAPLYDTVQGPSKGVRYQYSSTQAGFYVDGPTGSLSSEMLALIAAHPNIIAHLSGHTHSAFQAEGLVSTLVLGGRNVAAINAGALIYEYTFDRTNAPVHTIYVHREDTGIAVTFRDHGTGSWVGTREGQRVERVEIA